MSVAEHTAVRAPRPPRARTRVHPALVAAAVLPVTAVVYLVNLRAGLDFDLDEVMYVTAGQNIATAGSVSWGPQPIFVHPPLYFLALAGWTLLTGTAHGDVPAAILSARYLGAAFSVLSVLLVGLLALRYAAGRTPAARSVIMAAAMLLATFDGFLIRFGRTGLIEPAAILAGLLVVLLALRLRSARGPVYVGVVGVASGLALLIKEPLLFTVVVPVLAAVLERDWAHLRRTTAAVLTGLGLWAVFPLWAVLHGAGGWWWAEHDTSLHRLAGVLQVSGLNRTGVSTTGVLGDTFGGYVSGYLIFGLGACGLLVAAYRGGLFHRRALSRPVAGLVAFGLLSYGFLVYCVLLGQANEQLTAYSAAPAVLLAVVPWPRPTPRPVLAAGLLAVVAGLAAWVLTVVVVRDDATVRTGQFLAARAACAPVNATGNALRWAPALPANPVYEFSDGPSAVNAGLHLFLLSPKDSRMRYGTSSPELDTWVRAHGRLLHSEASRRYERIEVWSVPGPARATGEQCGNDRPPVAPNASSTSFLILLGGVLVLLTAALYAWSIAQRHQPWDEP